MQDPRLRLRPTESETASQQGFQMILIILMCEKRCYRSYTASIGHFLGYLGPDYSLRALSGDLCRYSLSLTKVGIVITNLCVLKLRTREFECLS